MRRRVIGATLTVLGVSVLLFKPAQRVSGCADNFVTGGFLSLVDAALA
jgi:hypothetical protein